MRTIKKYIKHPSSTLAAIIQRMNFLFHSEKLYLKIIFRLRMGYKLDLDNPKTFSEKLQWLKLYNRKPEYTQMVDKYAAKEYVANIIGDKYIIPTLGVWDRFEDIDFDKLPNQFVLKTTHGGGDTGVVICRDKAIFDREKARCKLSKSLKHCIYRRYKEWPYKNVKRRIIAEQLLGNNESSLNDYKFFCFNGDVKCCQVISGRDTTMSIDFFDKEWDHLPFHEPRIYPFSKEIIERPNNYDEMWQIASKLSKNHPFLRVDFYSIGDQIYFGELTFFPSSGFGGFYPVEWDYIFGEWIKLPKIING